jgi:hypothetical protein
MSNPGKSSESGSPCTVEAHLRAGDAISNRVLEAAEDLGAAMQRALELAWDLNDLGLESDQRLATARRRADLVLSLTEQLREIVLLSRLR